jgi:hypothetical protein
MDYIRFHKKQHPDSLNEKPVTEYLDYLVN